jgi:hypothetical protein
MIARDLRVIAIGACMGTISCVFLTTIVFFDRRALASDPLLFLLNALQLGFLLAVMFGAPLGAVGGGVAVWHLRTRPDFPTTRWPGRGAAIGAALGGVGCAIPFLISKESTGAAFYALMGSIAGTFAGTITAVVLRRVLANPASSPRRA